MARPKKKNSDPKMSMEQLLNRAVTLFQEPYDDRDERDVAENNAPDGGDCHLS